MNDFQDLKDALAEALYGQTPAEAHQAGLCIQCKQPARERCYSQAGLREYEISGLCEPCFDEITKEPEDDSL
jgi:hypothetical protein